MQKPNPTKACLLCEILLLLGSFVTLIYWSTGKGMFYTEASPVLSPFTSASLLLMVGGRLAYKYLPAMPLPLYLAWLVLVIGGNLSSIILQASFPMLVADAFPGLVTTSMQTSFGLIAFCTYEVLILMRKTPKRAFILDDFLVHLALIPGGLSLIGHGLGNWYYISSMYDPKVGIGLLEMGFMACYAAITILSNTDLFLWHFLKQRRINVLIFTILFVNQYIAPIAVGFISGRYRIYGLGIELFVFIAGVLTTMLFLGIQAIQQSRSHYA